MDDTGVSLPTRVLVPPIPLAQEAVRETVPSVIEPVMLFASGPSPCEVPWMIAKLVLTEVCDVIVGGVVRRVAARFEGERRSSGTMGRRNRNGSIGCTNALLVVICMPPLLTFREYLPLDPHQAQLLGLK
jgi:hypothetical protein